MREDPCPCRRRLSPGSRRPRPWWSRPVQTDVCSMFARTSRYVPVRPGSTRYPRATPDTGNRTERQVAVGTVIARQQLREKNRTEQQTLNLRVRGSSPWRRTHSDLGLYVFRVLSCRPFPGHGCSTVARQSGPSRRPARARDDPLRIWSRPLRLRVGVGAPSDGTTQRETRWQTRYLSHHV